MAIYNIGRVAYVNRGNYSPTFEYQKMDVAQYNNGSYLFTSETPSSGKIPTNYDYWQPMLDPTDMNLATANADGNVINSVSFGQTDIIFKKENEDTISLANAREVLKGDTGDSGVYIGETAPDNGATVWIDTTGMPSRMYFRDTHVQVSDFVADATHTKYPFKADVVCLGTTPDLFAFVVFSSESLIEFIYAPFCESGTDIVTIYSTKKPTEELVIPLIEVMQI